MDTLDGSRQLGDGLPRRRPRAEPEDGLYTKEEFEDTMANIRARIPTMKLDTIERRSHTSKMYGRNSCSSASFRRM